MKAEELMTEQPACCTPDDSVQKVANLMNDNDCGCLPVVSDQESKKIVGVVTDRDLACRCLGEGKGAETPVSEVMSGDPSCCTLDSDADEVKSIMAERQVRRVPVVDSQGCCVGIIAQADLALAEQESSQDVRRTVERISEPDKRSRTEVDAGKQQVWSGG